MARKDANQGKAEQLAERRLKSLEMRKAGMTYREIGAALGITESQAWNDVKHSLRRLAKVEQDHAREYRQLEAERIDSLIKALWVKAKGRRYQDEKTGDVVEVEPDLKAMDRVMRLMDKRARLFGLDLQPEKEVPETEVVIRVVYGDGE